MGFAALPLFYYKIAHREVTVHVERYSGVAQQVKQVLDRGKPRRRKSIPAEDRVLQKVKTTMHEEELRGW